MRTGVGCGRLGSDALKMLVVCSLQTPVNTYMATWSHDPKDQNWQFYCRENPKSQIF
jgi:hypothetical protein